jgi:hypothetical protein
MIEMQEAFEIMSLHLLKQNKRSQNADRSGCAYRGEDGTCCGVGILIKDEFYSPELEGYSAHSIKVKNALRASRIRVEEGKKRFFTEIQDIHDNHAPYKWLTKLRRVGEDWDLDITFLEGYEQTTPSM